MYGLINTRNAPSTLILPDRNFFFNLILVIYQVKYVWDYDHRVDSYFDKTGGRGASIGLKCCSVVSSTRTFRTQTAAEISLG